MKRTASVTALAAIMLLILGACSGRKEGSRAAADSGFAIIRLDLALDSLRSSGALDSGAIPDSLVAPLRAIMVSERVSMSPDSFAALYAGSQVFGVFEPDVCRLLPDLSDINRSIGGSFAALRAMGAGVPALVAGYVTPYNQSVVTVDSVMLLGLNHYLGPDYEGYSGFDAYRRAMKTPGRIPYDATEAVLAESFPYQASPYSTLLSRLIYEGAVVSAIMEAVPDAELSLALGMTPEQLKWCEDNEHEIWQKLAGANLLYSTSALDADKLVAPAPSATIVHPDAPGRVGRYIGYKIVAEALARNKDLTLAKVLSADFYNSESALRQSGYRP